MIGNTTKLPLCHTVPCPWTLANLCTMRMTAIQKATENYRRPVRRCFRGPWTWINRFAANWIRAGWFFGLGGKAGAEGGRVPGMKSHGRMYRIALPIHSQAWQPLRFHRARCGRWTTDWTTVWNGIYVNEEATRVWWKGIVEWVFTSETIADRLP